MDFFTFYIHDFHFTSNKMQLYFSEMKFFAICRLAMSNNIKITQALKMGPSVILLLQNINKSCTESSYLHHKIIFIYRRCLRNLIDLFFLFLIEQFSIFFAFPNFTSKTWTKNMVYHTCSLCCIISEIFEVFSKYFRFVVHLNKLPKVIQVQR